MNNVIKFEDCIMIFEDELRLIEDFAIAEFTANCIKELPDYFFKIPASSSGNNHPKYAIQKCGLVKHTKAAIAVALELLRLEEYKDVRPLKSYVIAALLLHDGLKNGKQNSGKTVSEHPILMQELIISIGRKCKKSNIANVIGKLVLSHMGQWNRDYDTDRVIMPKPKSPAQKLVHMADYIASRKFLEVDFTRINYNV